MHTIGLMTGMLLSPYAAKTFGPRDSIILCCGKASVAYTILFFSADIKSYPLICIGFLLVGFANGILINALWIYLIEFVSILIKDESNSLNEWQTYFFKAASFTAALFNQRCKNDL